MPLQVEDLETLEGYLSGVMDRSSHHAETVGAVALALIGAVLWKKDDEPIQVRGYNGRPANVLWVYIAGRRYALAYNHGEGCIELHDRTQGGEVIFRFTNSTRVTEVWRVFEELKPALDRG